MTQAQLLEQFIDRLGLRYFKGKELTPYWSRNRGGVKNSVPAQNLWHRIPLTLYVLDELRHRLGYGVTITSSYRSPAYNAAVGGEPNSFHMRFMAIDLQGAQGSPEEWHEMAKSLRGEKFNTGENGQKFVFRGGIGLYKTFIHIDTRKEEANW